MLCFSHDAGEPTYLLGKLGTLFDHLSDEAEFTTLAPEPMAGHARMTGAGAFPPGEVYHFAPASALLSFLRIHVEGRIAETKVEVIATANDAFEKTVVVFLVLDFHVQRGIFPSNLQSGFDRAGIDFRAYKFPIVTLASNNGIDAPRTDPNIEDSSALLLPNEIGQMVDVFRPIRDGGTRVAFGNRPVLDFVMMGKQRPIQHQYGSGIREINGLIARRFRPKEIS